MSLPTRRRFLRGLGGVTLALPVAGWLAGREGRARAATGGPYSFFFHQANGVQQATRYSGGEPERFWPRAEGSISRASLEQTDADRATSELAAYADKLLLLKGLQQSFGFDGCSHEMALAECMTAARVIDVNYNALAQGDSIDWRIAQRCNPAGVDPLNLIAGRADAHRLSYSGPGARRGAQNNPLSVYMNMVGAGQNTPEIADAVASRRKSVNDFVRGEMQDLMSSTWVGQAEKKRLNQHFEAIRDIEIRMSCALAEGEVDAFRAIENSITSEDKRIEVAKLHMDLVAFAFSCDMTRVATLQFGDGSTRFTIDGTKQNTFHRISHRVDSDGTDGPPIPNADMLHHKIDREFAKMFRYFLDRLSMYAGPSGGSLLDDSIAMWFSSLADGAHDRYYLPYVIAGSGGGFLKQGVALEADEVRVNKLYNTVLRAHGVNEDFGDPSLEGGMISSLLA